MKFSLRISSVNMTKSPLVTFIEEILKGKLDLCAVSKSLQLFPQNT